MKPYRAMPIRECGEPLEYIPKDLFAFYQPHPYQSVGAPYGDASPWMLRRGVLKALKQVREKLLTLRPGWKILIFDAYRPNRVQAFMVDREFAFYAGEMGFHLDRLTTSEREMLENKVFRVWGIPSEDPATPPAHSTGAAVDLTFADENGKEIDMGSPIDENSDRSNPDYFANATNEADKLAHANRILLRDMMKEAGFHMNPVEWWHFSQGDQYWAYLERQVHPGSDAVARYGRADLVK